MKTFRLTKSVVTVILVPLVVLLSSIPAGAASSEIDFTSNNSKIVYLENGNRIEFEIQTELLPSTRATERYQKSQTAKYVDKNDKTLCSLTVIGVFEVNYGTSVKCVDSYCKKYESGNSWVVENMSTSRNNNSSSTSYVYGKAFFVKKFLGISIEKNEVNLTISMDKYGK